MTRQTVFGPRHRAGAAVAAAAVVLAAGALLAGCTPGTGTGSGTGGPASAGATPTSPDASAAPSDSPLDHPEPTPAIPAYTLDQLKRTVADSGLTCTTFTDAPVEGGSGGWCQESKIGIFVFADQAAADALVERSAASSEPQPFLVGNRWVITTNDPSSRGEELFALQDVIGGSLEGRDL